MNAFISYKDDCSEKYNGEHPLVYIQETSGITARRETAGTEAIKTIMQIADFEQLSESKYLSVYDSCVIPKFGRMKQDMIVSSGNDIFRDGIFRKCKEGLKEVARLGAKPYPKLAVGDAIINAHELMFFSLYPDAFDQYMRDSSLCINHTIIDATGDVRYETNPFYMELVPRGLNTLHGRFIKKWGMYGVPVSAVDVVWLDAMFDEILKKDNLSKPDVAFTCMMKLYLNIVYNSRYSAHKFKPLSDADYASLCGFAA